MKYLRSAPIKLSDKFFDTPEIIEKEIQLLRVGKFFHDGQEIEITKKDLKQMVKNFQEKVRGIDLMLDFSHESEKEAAAWFNDVYLSESGKELWAIVDWTEKGEKKVRKKEYRYISADFTFSYKDNESLKEHGATLFGAGLTNRPVVKGMAPVILSENNSEGKMPNEDFKKELEEMKTTIGKKDAKIKELEEKLAGSDKKLSEKLDEIKLSEEKVAEEKLLTDKKEKFDVMLSEGKAVEAQRDGFMKDDMAEFVKNAVSAEELNLSENGTGKESNKENKFADSETPAQDEVIELSEKLVKEEKISLSEAQERVLSENKELCKKYDEESNL
ncbi:hypothetical protein KAR91_40740 [Candidatus Pacearchaeota archaeon]|nr:hypothetical protein [Candidatus Pacearchaeota archaeon]